VRRGAVIAAALVVAVVAFILISGGDDDNSGSGQPIGADAEKIQELAADVGHPVYWAGPTGADQFEWTESADGKVYIRYLTDNADPGDPRPLYLTIATYPVGGGVQAVRKAGQIEGNHTIKLPGGATGLVSDDPSTSVYLAYPGSPYQIEVFNPDPAKALSLVKSGRIQPVP
jgi:hypothetical protein